MVANPLCCPWPCHAVGTRHQPGGERPGPCTSSRGRAKSILALNPRSPGQQRMHGKTRPCAAGLVALDNPSSTRAGSGSDGLFMPHASPSAAPAKVILEVTMTEDFLFERLQSGPDFLEQLACVGHGPSLLTPRIVKSLRIWLANAARAKR